MRRRPVFVAGLAGALALAGGAVAGCGGASTSGGGSAPAAGGAAGGAGGKRATIELEKGGSVVIQLFPDAAPQTVKNFEDKASKGFYNGLTFHRVEDWVVQGGDPRGTGTGGGQMPTELSERAFTVGAVGVARGPDIRVSNDSQFFICTKPADWLNKQYTNFGQVLSGMEAVQKIARGDKIKTVSVAG
jgi:cyclophilin family peptidyl-prolyl cis-trans isomerase